MPKKKTPIVITIFSEDEVSELRILSGDIVRFDSEPIINIRVEVEQ